MGEAVAEMPTWSQVRQRVNALAAADGEWAGMPLPVDGLKLSVEPRYRYQNLNGFCLTETLSDGSPAKPVEAADGFRVRNSWHSVKAGGTVVLYEEGFTGKALAAVLPEHGPAKRLDYAINTIGASRVWDVQAEARAMEKLRVHVNDYKFGCYFMTGSFLETSERSGVTYLFRRCRPTLALKGSPDDSMRPLAALCLHPVGYYEESWGGVMVPTDCLLAHLLLCRGDEHRYWKLSNQHPLHYANAGV